MDKEHSQLIVGLTCGGDGVCSITWPEAKKLLGGKPGRIAVARKHDQSYGVWGSVEELKKKVPLKRWPSLMFEGKTQV